MIPTTHACIGLVRCFICSFLVVIRTYLCTHHTQGQITLPSATSKAALNNLVKVLAIENSNLKIKFNTICPGVVNTEFNDVVDNLKSDKSNILENRYPLGFGNPNDISSLIKYFLVENTWISGQNIVIDGGFSIN